MYKNTFISQIISNICGFRCTSAVSKGRSLLDHHNPRSNPYLSVHEYSVIAVVTKLIPSSSAFTVKSGSLRTLHLGISLVSIATVVVVPVRKWNIDSRGGHDIREEFNSWSPAKNTMKTQSVFILIADRRKPLSAKRRVIWSRTWGPASGQNVGLLFQMSLIRAFNKKLI